MYKPNIGDTIVTVSRGNYICNIANPDGSFQGSRKSGFNNWNEDGSIQSAWRDPIGINDEFRVVKIISKQSTVIDSLEFRVRVLEKENEMLTRLLLKEGVL